MTVLKWIGINRKRLQYVLVMRTIPEKFTLIWLTFVIGAFSHDFVPLPQSYFSNRNNIFNVLFAKRGWGWTLLLLFTYLLSILLKQGVRKWLPFYKHLSRLIILTFNWYLMTSLFEVIESATGKCVGNDSISQKETCRKEGFMWSGFDISGHCYLLSFCILIINKELHGTVNFKESARNGGPVEEHDGNQAVRVLKVNDIEITDQHVNFIMECSSLLLVILMVLWEVLLFFTCAYFHTLLQKLLGILTGLASWYISYEIIFASEHPFAPTSPTVIAHSD